MPITDQVTLTDGTTNHVYDIVSAGEFKKQRKNFSAPLDKPEQLLTSNQLNEKTNVLRSLVRLQTTVIDGGGEVGDIKGSFVLEVPLNVATDADVQKVRAQLVAFLTSANVSALLQRGS